MAKKGTKKTGKVPKRGNKKVGRPGYDWEDLYQEWKSSGLPKSTFLKSKGIAPKGGSTSRNTRDWTKRMAGEHDAISETRANYLPSRQPEKVQTVANVVPVDKRDAIGIIEPEAKAKGTQPASWQVIQQWRTKQATEDYKTSNNIRDQIKIILRNSTKRVYNSETGKEEYVTDLSPMQVKQLAEAAEKIQRVQRLALGLSTDNVGIPLEPEPVEDGDDTVTVPVFEVQMTDKGKFVTQRPRRVK